MQKTVVDAMLCQMHGGTFVGLDTTTVPELSGGKKNPMKGRVLKHTVGSRVMVFQKGGEDGAYKRMVDRRLAKEGKGEHALQPRAWGTRIEGTPYVEHKGAYYLEVIFMNSGDVYYTLDGDVIAKKDIEGLVEREPNPDGQSRLDDKVIIRTYSLESIDHMRAMGKVA